MLKLLLFLRNQMSSSSVVSFLKKFFPVKTKYSGKESVTLTISSLVTQGSTLITNDLSRLCDEVKCVDFEEESQYQHKLCWAIILFSSMFSCVCLFVCRLWFDNIFKKRQREPLRQLQIRGESTRRKLKLSGNASVARLFIE